MNPILKRRDGSGLGRGPLGSSLRAIVAIMCSSTLLALGACADETDPPAPQLRAGPSVEETKAPPGPAPSPQPVLDTKPKSKMTFFVTSTGTRAQGGNLGGLDGADKMCQRLATAANAGDHTWHAYLSVQGSTLPALPGTSAKDRIGTGPWVNHKGTLIASDVTSLHAVSFKAVAADFLDETGAPIPATAGLILTGSDTDGGPVAGRTCNNWTSAIQKDSVQLGDINDNESALLGASWNDGREVADCTETGLKAKKSEGRLYCFAID